MIIPVDRNAFVSRDLLTQTGSATGLLLVLIPFMAATQEQEMIIEREIISKGVFLEEQEMIIEREIISKGVFLEDFNRTLSIIFSSKDGRTSNKSICSSFNHLQSMKFKRNLICENFFKKLFLINASTPCKHLPGQHRHQLRSMGSPPGMIKTLADHYREKVQQLEREKVVPSQRTIVSSQRSSSPGFR